MNPSSSKDSRQMAPTQNMPSGYRRMRALLFCFTLALVGMGLCSFSIREQSNKQPRKHIRFSEEISPIVETARKRRSERSAIGTAEEEPKQHASSSNTDNEKSMQSIKATKTKEKAPVAKLLIPQDFTTSGNTNTIESNSSSPEVIWLMSFPNSGTSFTGELIKQVTKSRTASNYGKGNFNASGWSVPVHEGDFRGPFFVDPPKENSYDYDNKFIMTKTHCGGYCQSCRPSSYDMTLESFGESCVKSNRVWEENGTKMYEKTEYPRELVKKAIHLIRDPFDNIVSRFHLEVHEFRKVNDVIPEHLEDSRDGFRLFCTEVANRYSPLEEKSDLWHRQGMEVLKAGIPCYADFYRWVQWHNLANELTKEMGIPTYVLNYEKFETQFDETLEDILNFLEQGRKGKPYKFIRGKAYKEYFYPGELESVRTAMKHLATNETWSLIKHYFE